jgi:GTPase
VLGCDVAEGATAASTSETAGNDESGGVKGTGSGANHRIRAYSEVDMLQDTYSMVTLVDTCGLQRFYKHTLHGLLSCEAKHCILTVAMDTFLNISPAEATRSISAYAGLVMQLGLNLAIVLNKVDKVSQQHDGLSVRRFLCGMLDACSRRYVFIDSISDLAAVLPPSLGEVIPIFTVSCVTGQYPRC